ncbi:histone-like nucleoid-structuring protein Lsr2 [Corynebacterium terpenotabidum]|uniref:Multifunctional histone-like protein n=1 Tax=Corynebacterium terpenotabidum Y-11 TaxID=1200352 RepID=S4XBG8_9CORY|nr:Lsr2 family protein [Corynebacterium terpenotabidum]AGP29819.1 multifunctional histone-like protein [Corynebacterium terpenotabidum Y-11]
MARREITQFFDDVDGTALSSDEVNVVEFSYAGSDYTLDLSEENALKFAHDLEPYLKVATKVTRARAPRGRGAASSATKSDPNRNRRIREWARDNNHAVSARGQISHEIIAAYEAANPADR